MNENNVEQAEQIIAAQEIEDTNFDNVSVFEGTPWTSDQEIYDYASHRKYNLGWDWNNIKDALIKEGLDADYAQAIIQNLIAASYSTEPQPATYIKGFIVGVLGSAFIAAIGAAICIMLQGVWSWLIVIGTVLIGKLVQKMSNKDGFITALIAAICGVVAVVVFTYLIEYQGYIWDDGSNISDHMLLYMGAAALVSGWAGFKTNTSKE